MSNIDVTFPSGCQPGKILKWKVSKNTMVSAGRVLLLYHNVNPENEDAQMPEKKLKATKFGCVKMLLAKTGDIIQPGQVIATLEGCTHRTVMKDLCAECGMDLRMDESSNDGKAAPVSQASVAMVHSIPELKVSPELAEKIGKEDEQRLLNDRKLALLVDLDQTIVHTTNDNIPPNMKDVYHYQLYGPNSPWYHTRLRPNTRHFLEEISKLYELHICTFGARIYAHTVAALLDKDATLFSHRILSRDECFDPASKTANLKALFPCGDDLVCIIDDREDVWQGCGNLVQVKAYHFFRHSGDIHAPPGLEKSDTVVVPESTTELQSFTEESVNKDGDKTNKNGLTEDAEKEIVAESDLHSENQTNNSHCKFDKLQEKDIQDQEASTVIEKDAETNTYCENVNSDKTETELLIKPEKSEKQNDTQVCNEGTMLDEDDDDYLLYLEDILRRIHTEFYAEIENKTGRKSLREIIPAVRGQVLKGLYLTFSGLIPTNQKLHQSRAYKVARAFGAEVTQDLTEKTTHLVAIKPGTAKVNSAKKNTTIKIVNPVWLWTCAERWEHVDERLFPLSVKERASRIPPPHCTSPERMEQEEKENCFADSINPLMSFTQEEIEIMDKEVDEDMDDIDSPVYGIDDTEGIADSSKRMRKNSDSEDSTYENDRKTSVKKKKICNGSSDENSSGEKDGNNGDDDNDNNSDQDEEFDNMLCGVLDDFKHIEDGDTTEDRTLYNSDQGEDNDDIETRFRRGEIILDDLEHFEDSEDDQDIAGQHWNAMGAALERDFLSE